MAAKSKKSKFNADEEGAIQSTLIKLRLAGAFLEISGGDAADLGGMDVGKLALDEIKRRGIEGGRILAVFEEVINRI